MGTWDVPEGKSKQLSHTTSFDVVKVYVICCS